MLNDVLGNIGRFIFLILFQGIILNDVNLMDGMAIPYLYVIVILMLPLETPRWLELIIGLVCGISMDMFTNTLGIHASACVMLAYARPLMLRAIAPRDGYEFGQWATIQSLGLTWYLKYAGLLIFVHHTWLFFLEVYSFKGFFDTFARVIFSTMFTLILAILSQYLITSNKTSRAV